MVNLAVLMIDPSQGRWDDACEALYARRRMDEFVLTNVIAVIKVVNVHDRLMGVGALDDYLDRLAEMAFFKQSVEGEPGENAATNGVTNGVATGVDEDAEKALVVQLYGRDGVGITKSVMDVIARYREYGIKV